MLAQVGSFVLGVVLLMLGADSLARGIGGLALRSGASSFGVGLASTALSALVPALAVTLAAGYARQPDLAFGSLVGGSIAQIGLVLGLCALAAPLRARLKLFRRANPALMAAGLLLWLLSLDARIGTFDGAILILAWFLVAALVVGDARTENEEVRNEIAAATGTRGRRRRDPAVRRGVARRRRVVFRERVRHLAGRRRPDAARRCDRAGERAADADRRAPRAG